MSTNAARQQPSVRPVVIFLHIGKTAGTTIRQILRKQYRSADTLLIRSRPLRAEGEADRPTREATIGYFASLSEAERARPVDVGHDLRTAHPISPHDVLHLSVIPWADDAVQPVARNPNHPPMEPPATGPRAYVTESHARIGQQPDAKRSLATGDRSVMHDAFRHGEVEHREGLQVRLSTIRRVLMLLRDAFG